MKRASLPPVSLSVFSLAPELLLDCSRVLEYAEKQTVLQSKLGVKFKTSSHARSNIYSQSYFRLCIARPSGIIPFGWRGEITGKKSAFAGYCSNETAINFK